MRVFRHKAEAETESDIGHENGLILIMLCRVLLSSSSPPALPLINISPTLPLPNPGPSSSLFVFHSDSFPNSPRFSHSSHLSIEP